MRITVVETIYEAGSGSPLTFVRLHTEDGTTGLGETYYTPRTVVAYIHEVLAPTLLQLDVPADGLPWNALYDASARRGPGGADARALAAVDLAMWDLRGKALGAPVYALLGGAVQPAGPRIYNTCAGGRYASATAVGTGRADDRDDLWRATNDPGGLATELVESGYNGMKLWPFDVAAGADDGRRISAEGLRAGYRILEKIRDAVGDRIDLMLEGHGQWHLAPAQRILREVADLDLFWAEDLTLAHDPTVLKRLAASTSVPLAVSEYLVNRWQFNSVFRTGAVSYAHLDPSWCGGISESQRVIALASSWGIDCAIHDCTGPINLLAGLHLGTANSNVVYQETLRSFLDEVYPELVDTAWTLDRGHLAPPAVPGLGACLSEQYLSRPSLVIERSGSRP